MQEPINHGVLLGRKPSDWVAGAIPFENRNPSGNWKDFLPPGEWQYKNGKDTMACVTFSLLNCIETQEFFLTGQRINYSDRWIALMSGTTEQGNYLYKVADAVRQYGLVREESWPAPETFDRATYYAAPSPEKMKELLAEGQEWLKTHQFNYEWLTVDRDVILQHLQQSPLQVVIPGHAVEGFYEIGDTTKYFDSYEPFQKETWYRNLSDVLKPVLTITNMPKNQTKVVMGKDGKTVWICTPCSKMEVLKERASVEGFVLPAQIPPATTL